MAQPQLVIQDFGGAHNAQPDQTRARLIKGASWKKQRVIVVIPAGDSIPAKVALSLWNLGFPPNNGVVRILAQGLEVGDAYTTAIEQILAHPDLSQWEYLLTVEHDNAPPSDGVVKLIAQLDAHPELSCVGGLYFTKGPDGVAQIWGDPTDAVLNFRPRVPVDGQLVECCGTGMGFNLFRLAMFKDARLRKPWFKTLAGADGFATQDLYFWTDARKYGYRCAIDCAVKVGHFDAQNDVMW
jgi:hypothetical protein